MVTEEILQALVGKVVRVTFINGESHEGVLLRDTLMFMIGPDYFTHHYVKEISAK